MEFPAHLNSLPEMLEFIRVQAQAAGSSDDRLYKIELACEEALVNIISYAYPEEKVKTLMLECRLVGRRFEILIRDQGIPFNPIDAEVSVDVHQSIEERKIGGLGIFMIRKLVDEVSYRRMGEENVLCMVVILGAPEHQS